MRMIRKTINIPPDLSDAIEKLAAANRVDFSEQCRRGLRAMIEKPVSERNLMLKTLGKMDRNIYSILDRLMIQDTILENIVRTFFAHIPELDESLKDSAWETSGIRLQKFIENVKLDLEESPTTMNRIVIDYLNSQMEKKDD